MKGGFIKVGADLAGAGWRKRRGGCKFARRLGRRKEDGSRCREARKMD